MNYEAKIGRRREGSGTNDAVNRAARDEEGETTPDGAGTMADRKRKPAGETSGHGDYC